MDEWLVDTNVLIDIIGADPDFGEKSLATLTRLSRKGILVLNPIIYSEVSAIVDSEAEINELLSIGLFRYDDLPRQACFLAGRAFQRYRKNQGQRKRMLADFLIGAHAAYADYGLVSRDRGYRKYFRCKLLDPSRNNGDGYF